MIWLVLAGLLLVPVTVLICLAPRRRQSYRPCFDHSEAEVQMEVGRAMSQLDLEAEGVRQRMRRLPFLAGGCWLRPVSLG